MLHKYGLPALMIVVCALLQYGQVFAVDEREVVNNERQKNLLRMKQEKQTMSVEPRSDGPCRVVTRYVVDDPDFESRGLAWDSGILWSSFYDYPDNAAIYKIDIAARTVALAFSHPGKGSMGLALRGSHLWNVDFLDDTIYQLTKTGQVVGGIPAPSGIATGLAWDGRNFWVTEWYDYKIYKLDPSSGAILGSLNAPSFEQNRPPYGLAWDGTALWVSDSNGIFRIDSTTGAILTSCTDSDFRFGRAFGLTWDGNYLWGAGYIENEIIKISVPGSNIPISPIINLLLSTEE
jgi:hypothetical protein